MNILFITSDSHNADFIGNCNNLTRTPTLDSLARDGVAFSSAYCSYPLCGPSRGSMFSGRYAHEIGAWANAFPWNGTPTGWPTALREAGILFAATGKMHLKGGVDLGIEQAFNLGQINTERHVDVFGILRDDQIQPRPAMYIPHWWDCAPREADDPLPVPLQYAHETTQRAVHWLENQRPTDRPWVFYVGYNRPHPPWNPRREIFEYYTRNLPDLTPKYLQPTAELHPVDQLQALHTCAYERGPEDIRRMHALYHGAIEELDEEIGKLLTALDRKQLREDTMIIYTSDHGEMIRAHGKLGKLSLYEDSIRVPLIVAGAGLPAGKRINAPVSLLDVFPTIADATGMPPDNDKHGCSLLPLATGGQDPQRPDFIVSEIHGNAWPRAGFAVRCGDWKLMEYLGYPPALYNLREDPDEMRDLVKLYSENDHRVKPHLAELRRLLRQWGDPVEIDRRAGIAQTTLREELIASGMMDKELRKEHKKNE